MLQKHGMDIVCRGGIGEEISNFHRAVSQTKVYENEKDFWIGFDNGFEIDPMHVFGILGFLARLVAKEGTFHHNVFVLL